MSKNICIWGASSTYGVGDQKFGGWVNRLRLYLDNQEADYYRVFNLGISGEPTTNLLKRIEIEAEARRPDIIIFGLGANDSSRLVEEDKNLTPLDEYEKNVVNLIGIAKKYSEVIIVVGAQRVDESRTNPLPWNTKKAFLNKDIEKYEDVLKKACKDNGALFIDVNDKFSQGDYNEYLFKDGLHPSEKGHEVICELVKEKLAL